MSLDMYMEPLLGTSALTLLPIHSQSSGSAIEFAADEWNEEEFHLFASLERDPFNDYNANEMQIYTGADDYRERVQLQVDDDTNRTMRVKVRINNVESVGLDFTLNNKYLSALQNYSIDYDGSNFSVYVNGIRVCYDDDTLPPSIADGVAGIAFGKDTKNTLTSAATDIACSYYNQSLGDVASRNLSRNTSMLSGVTYDGSRKGIFAFGQSNIMGPSTLTHTPTYTNSSLIKNLALDGQYKAYADPFMDPTNKLIGGTIMSGANAQTSYMGEVLDDLADDGGEWFVVGAGKGNTDMADDWRVYDTDASAAAMDNTMRDLAFTSCCRLLMGMQAGPMVAMVNHQGESDAQDATDETTYKTNFTALIEELRAVHGSNLPLVIVGLHAYDLALLLESPSVTSTNWNNTNTWREELASTIPNATFVDLSGFAARSGDEFHLRAADHPAIGVLISEAIQGML